MDLKSREILSLLERVRLLESENIRLLNENQGFLQELNYFRSRPPPQIIREIPVYESLPPEPRPVQIIDRKANIPSVIREVTEEKDQDLCRKIEFFMNLAEKNWGKELRNARFEIWRLKSQLLRRNFQGKSGKKMTKQLDEFEQIDLSPQKNTGFVGKMVDWKENLEGGRNIQLKEFSDDIFSEI